MMQTDTAQSTNKAGIAAFAEKLYFNLSYRFGFAPWDIKAAQPDLVRLVESNGVKGKSILDVGCGSGDNAIYLANSGFAVTGLDYSKQGIELAKRRAGKASVRVNFQVYNAFKLAHLQQQYDTVIDFGLYHNMKESDIPFYVNSLASVAKPHGQLILQCFSDKAPAKYLGPRRVSRKEIEDSFSSGWTIQEIRPAHYLTPKKAIPSLIAIISKQ